MTLFRYGGGIYCTSSSSPTISNVKIQNNTATHGAGIYIEGSSPSLSYLKINNNNSNQRGGGVYSKNSILDLKNSVISNNTANLENLAWEGGGIHIDGGTALMTECIIKGNTARYGGGIYLSSSGNNALINSVVSGNTANNQGNGGAIYFAAAYLNVVNSTIVSNTVSEDGSSIRNAVWMASNSSMSFSNSILYNSGIGEIGNDNLTYDGTGAFDYVASISYSIVEGWNVSSNGIINSNPIFMDLANGDYRLSNYSPAIGTGTGNGAPRNDLNGDIRPSPSGSSPDMGAYENALGSPSHNELIYVSTEGFDEGSVGTESSPFKTIQAAIDYSLNGDSILVNPGTYIENINYNGKDIVIGSLFLTTQDTSYIESTVIDGNEQGSVVTFQNEETLSAELSGLTIQNGAADNGGGIFVQGSSPTLTYLLVKDNQALEGGGLYIHSSAPLLENLTISSNVSFTRAGGIMAWQDSYLTMKNSIIRDNSAATWGGGGWLNQGSYQAVKFISNTADKGGGFGTEGIPEFINCLVSGNEAEQGGGIFC